MIIAIRDIQNFKDEPGRPQALIILPIPDEQYLSIQNSLLILKE